MPGFRHLDVGNVLGSVAAMAGCLASARVQAWQLPAIWFEAKSGVWGHQRTVDHH